jgi:hypothetical protein
VLSDGEDALNLALLSLRPGLGQHARVHDVLRHGPEGEPGEFARHGKA